MTGARGAWRSASLPCRTGRRGTRTVPTKADGDDRVCGVLLAAGVMWFRSIRSSSKRPPPTANWTAWLPPGYRAIVVSILPLQAPAAAACMCCRLRRLLQTQSHASSASVAWRGECSRQHRQSDRRAASWGCARQRRSGSCGGESAIKTLWATSHRTLTIAQCAACTNLRTMR